MRMWPWELLMLAESAHRQGLPKNVWFKPPLRFRFKDLAEPNPEHCLQVSEPNCSQSNGVQTRFAHSIPAFQRIDSTYFIWDIIIESFPHKISIPMILLGSPMSTSLNMDSKFFLVCAFSSSKFVNKRRLSMLSARKQNYVGFRWSAESESE